MEIKPSPSKPIQSPSKKSEFDLNVLKERACNSYRNPSQLDKLNEDLKHVIQDILYDLMHSGDIAGAVQSLRSNKLIDGIEFTKRALIFGIERQAYERELVSKLLSACYELFNDNEIEDGFQLLLFRLPDIVLDVPHAPSLLAKFIARAIYDEIVPPIFVKEAHVDNVKAKECMSLAFAKTHALDETKEGLEHIWGPGDMTSVKNLKVEVDSLLEEYLENPDVKETTAAFVELNVPSFFAEVIKRGLFKALGMNEKAHADFLKLLEHWFQINLISVGHLKRGFSMAYTNLPDLCLDVPKAPQLMQAVQKAATEKKLLPENFSPINPTGSPRTPTK